VIFYTILDNLKFNFTHNYAQNIARLSKGIYPQFSALHIWINDMNKLLASVISKIMYPLQHERIQ